MRFYIKKATDIYKSNNESPHKDAVYVRTRRGEYNVYEIEINSLEELLSLSDLKGGIVIKYCDEWAMPDDDSTLDKPSIIIYS